MSLLCGYATPGLPERGPPLGIYAPDMRTRYRNTLVMGLYDAPLWADWLFYLTALGVIAVIPNIGATAADAFVVILVETALAVGFQFFLFGVVPGVIRKRIRHRRLTRTTSGDHAAPTVD
jgi:hypothetical protein